MLNYFHKTAQNSAEAAIQALTAGLDAEASDNSYAELQQLVENGMLDVKYIDQAVARILTAKFNMGLFEYPLPMEKNYDKVPARGGLKARGRSAPQGARWRLQGARRAK